MTTASPWSQWIVEDKITSLHQEGIKRHGGKSGTAKNGCVSGALGAAYHAELYSAPEDASGYVAGLAFASYLLFYLITNHCYVDGNKRVSWTSCMEVLLQLGLTIDASDEEAHGFCESMANGTIKKSEQVVAWIAEHLKAI